MMSEEFQSMAANAIAHAAEMVKAAVFNAVSLYERPSAIYRPALSIDGNQWCALYGANLQDGVAGFGDSPAQAMWAFDAAWSAPLPSPEKNHE